MAKVKKVLMGNEAIAWALLAQGATVLTSYPGTPASEILASARKFKAEKGLEVWAEWAVNEKVAFEIALTNSWIGGRSAVMMKQVGLNVALDPLMSAAYAGVKGGFVVVSADDPGPYSSQTEQDSRYYAKMANLPMIEPSTPAEAKEFTLKAFELSESLNLPVLLRATTRVSHSTQLVELGPVKERKRERSFKKEPKRYIRASMAWNLSRHRWLNEKIREASELMRRMGLDRVEGSGEFGILCSGVSYCYVKEALKVLGLEAKVIKIGAVHPLDGDLLARETRNISRLVVVEELQPFLEEEASSRVKGVEVRGKLTGDFPFEGEYSPELVAAVLSKLCGVPFERKKEKALSVPRPPPLCPGCPHRSAYVGLLKALEELGYSKDEVPIMGDIGCYALSLEPPLEAIWTEHCMGASISLAARLKIAGIDKPVIATIGDSTFFHNGIQPLLEIVHKRIPIVVAILDNGTVAMTGHQSTPEWEITESGRRARRILPEDIARSIGIKTEVVDPFDLEATVKAFKEAIKAEEPRVIVLRQLCAILARRKGFIEEKAKVDPEKCRGCGLCVKITGCPAIRMEEGKAFIDPELCAGCPLCAQVCPFGAITPGRWKE